MFNSKLFYSVSSLLLLILSIFVLNLKGYFNITDISVVSNYSQKENLEKTLNEKHVYKTPIYSLSERILMDSLGTSFTDIKDLKLKKNYLKRAAEVSVVLHTPIARVLGKPNYFISFEGQLFESEASEVSKKDLPVVTLKTMSLKKTVFGLPFISFITSLKEYPKFNIVFEDKRVLIYFFDKNLPNLIISSKDLDSASIKNMSEKINYLFYENPQSYQGYEYIEVLENKLILKKSL